MTESPSSPSSLLVPGRVLLDMEADSKRRLFEEVGLAFENTNGPARGQVYKHLLERERLGSTVIAPGIAIPHARIEGLKNPLAAYLRMQEPMSYDGPESKVEHLFVLLAPDKADGTHLKILSQMSRLLTNMEFIVETKVCSSPAEFIDIVRKWEEMPADQGNAQQPAL